jgi:site-specific recombinase XerD
MSNTTPFGYAIPTARKVSPLRQRMIEDMTVRNFALNTQASYLSQVSRFARHFGKSPEQLGSEESRAYQICLVEQKKVSVSTRILAGSGLRFLYAVTLQRDWTVQLIPTPKRDHHLPVILSPQEVLQLLQAAPSFTHHVIFSTMYGTGMRISEVMHLRAANIDSQRMMIRIELSKGHKDRDVQLSPKLLELLRCYWQRVPPGEWMFPGQNPVQPLTREPVSDAVARASQRAGLKKQISPHSFRHASAYCTTFQSSFILKTIGLGRARSAGFMAASPGGFHLHLHRW